MPKEWTYPTDEYREVEVAEDSSEFQQVAANLMKTIGGKGSQVLKVCVRLLMLVVRVV